MGDPPAGPGSGSSSESDYHELNTTHHNFMELRSRFFSRVKPRNDQKSYGGMGLPHPIVLEAQLMERAPDKRLLRGELELLVRRQVIRVFDLALPGFPSERYFVLEIDYVDQLELMHDPTVDRFLRDIARPRITPTVRRDALTSARFTDSDIRELVACKCLLIRSGGVFQFALPSAGAAIASVAEGRKTLVAYVNRLPAKIAERQQVERRPIDRSIFYAEFHVQELIEVGVFEVVTTHRRPDRIHLAYDPYASAR
jgi:hypothetical protein